MIEHPLELHIVRGLNPNLLRRKRPKPVNNEPQGVNQAEGDQLVLMPEMDDKPKTVKTMTLKEAWAQLMAHKQAETEKAGAIDG